LGLREFSMTPAAITMARQAIRDLNAREARALARKALTLPTASEIEQYLFDSLAGQVFRP
jgi:phosphotransferase system enzyme I (PtsI)